MKNLLDNSPEILILLLLTITFLQSGLDKIFDWKGNVSWLKEHFSKTFFKNHVPLALFKVLVIELLAGVLCLLGIVTLIANDDNTFGFYGAVAACIALLMLLFGQRVAK
ncbi:MAG: DoxX family membrane protein, partial [Bacteroidota bacterium]